MRLRFAVPASLLAAIVVAAAPTAALAAPTHNHGITISATPDPINSGDAVLIYGQLHTAQPGGQTIELFHRVNPSRHFSLVGKETTDPTGRYEFLREENVVLTNRSWFVRALLPGNVHSRTVHEHVAALVRLAASSPIGITNHALKFTGHVSPSGHSGERVELQAQVGTSGDDWRNLNSGVIGPASNYSISYNFHQPGERELRVVFAGDDRNIRAESNTVTVTIEQTQNPTFTINAAPQNIKVGSPVTISGVLNLPNTTTPDPGIGVTLFGHGDGQAYVPLSTTSTGPGGIYTFAPQTPIHNQVYQVRTTITSLATPARSTAQEFVGVRDVVSLAVSSPTALVDGQVTFTGTVAPDKAGHVIYLQRLGADGDYHTVKVSHVLPGSTYSIGWTFGSAGTKKFRTVVPGGPENAGGVSTPVSVIVSLPPVATLTPAS